MYSKEDIDTIENYLSTGDEEIEIRLKTDENLKLLYDDKKFWESRGYIDVSDIPIRN